MSRPTNDSDYVKSYRLLVMHVGDSLNERNVESLDYVYEEKLRGSRPQHGKWTKLGLLRALETAGVFSSRKPHPLADVMGDAKRQDLQVEVNDFIGKLVITIDKLVCSRNMQ